MVSNRAMLIMWRLSEPGLESSSEEASKPAVSLHNYVCAVVASDVIHHQNENQKYFQA